MEALLKQEYIEDIPLHSLRPAEYLAIAQKAGAQLHWFAIGLTENTIRWQTPGDDYSGGEIVTITIGQKNATIHSRSANGYYWNEEQNKQNAARFGMAMAALTEAQEKTNRNLHPMHREKYGALLPSKSYLITPVIVYSNVLVFIAMVLSGISPLHPTTQSLFQWGGNFRPAVAGGEWWRLVTYIFLHGGAMHLLMNTFALLYIGMFLEPLMGRFRFASAYLLTGVCAGLMSIGVHGFSVGVGASGAIFGMYGVFLSMLTTSHIQKTLRKTMLRSILFFVVLNLLYGLQGNTDNAAHIGGLLSGIIVGYVYYPGINSRASINGQLATTALLTAAVILLTTFTLARF